MTSETAGPPTDGPITTRIAAIRRGRGWRDGLFAAIGTGVAVGLMEVAAQAVASPYWMIPFVTSIVLVLGLPDAEPAQPRALIGGHVLSGLCGLLVVSLLGPGAASAAGAVALAVLAMRLTRTMHPPAGINPFLIANEALGLGFVLGTVVPGALALALFAALWRRIGERAMPAAPP